MKVSKQRLIQIIKEELEQLQEQEPEAPQEDPLADSKMAMANKFKALYSQFPKLQGLDASEIQLLDQLLSAAIKIASEGSAKSNLSMALAKLGVK